MPLKRKSRPAKRAARKSKKRVAKKSAKGKKKVKKGSTSSSRKVAKGKKRVAKRVAKRAGSKTKKRVITKKNKAAAKKTRGGSGDDAVTKGVKIKNGGKEIFITDKVPDIQRSMNELDFDKCEVLKIDGEGFDNFHIKHRMPKLKKLTVDGFCCTKLTLNDTLTPKIQELNHGGNSNGIEITFDVKSKSLESVDLNFSQVDEYSVGRLTRNCPNLRKFTSYNTHVPDPLVFQSTRIRQLWVEPSVNCIKIVN